MEPDDHEPPSSSSFASSDVCCLPSPSSLKSTATSSRKVSPPPELKCETKQPPAPESPAPPSFGTDHLRLPEALADFKRKADAGGAATFRRFDYDPRNGRIATRRPGLVHEYFIEEFVYHLRLQLRSLGLQHQKTITGDFINKIRSKGSADIGLITTDSSDVPHAKRLTRSPDASFVHKDAGLSGVVVEVAYSQDGKKLPGLARDYLLHSYGKIKAVIGFDINRENKPCSVSVYRVLKTPSDNGRIKLGVEAVVHESVSSLTLLPDMISLLQAFRNSDNTPASGELTLRLHDFADDKRCEGVNDLHVSIPYSELCIILGEAEDMVPLAKIDSEEKKIFDLESSPSKPDEDLYPEDKT
ncbi:uncharacterized protein FFUJ_14185 [Fusarium fujikuroi IMI 58289]|uniref:Uncharacterized protein n=1 Tax=Gibberella fujikuroi (strain CBS 195.34 / IMI 58289 / NRRL A-6831) TaxID=1279085 RepID=S0ENA6_GIBF5|nr:uncharacterized protein FFUJ_14185 [Fusarium fujikuroi IMI 58289]CCT76182.1 uncharacterized protein FFUJ_14185 [Fusarium fujikuroi IMI 58289]SCO26797.1 uncharacterized protein FFM5_15066 [Fusarium fujikuroi]